MLASVVNNPYRLRPVRRGQPRPPAGPLPVRAAVDGRDRGDITAEENAKWSPKLPKFPKIKANQRYGGPKGFLLKMVEQRARRGRLRLHPDQRRRPVGHHHLRQGRAGRRRRRRAEVHQAGGRRLGPEGQEPACRHRLGRRQQRRGARPLRRPGLRRRTPATGRPRPGRPRRPSRRTRWPPASRTATACTRPSTATASTCPASTIVVRNEYSQQLRLRGQPDQGDHRLDQHRLRRPGHLDGRRQGQGAQAGRGRRRAEDPRLGRRPAQHPDRHAPRSARSTRPARYATFANDGVHVANHVVKEVRDANGKVIYKAKPDEKRAMSEDVAHDVTYALSNVVENGTGRSVQTLQPPGRRQDRHQRRRGRRARTSSTRRGSSATPSRSRPR